MAPKWMTFSRCTGRDHRREGTSQQTPGLQALRQRKGFRSRQEVDELDKTGLQGYKALQRTARQMKGGDGSSGRKSEKKDGRTSVPRQHSTYLTLRTVSNNGAS